MPNDLNMLRETKFGQKGFLQEDVLNYVDELQTKIEDLEKRIEDLKESGSNADTKQLNDIIKTLESKLRANDTTLANERQARERERQEYEMKLKRANANGGVVNPELEKELAQKDEIIAQKDIELSKMQEKVQEVKTFLLSKDEDTSRRIAEKDAEIVQLNETINKLTTEKQVLEETISGDTSKTQINELNQTIVEQQNTIEELQSTITQLNAELDGKVDINNIDELSQKLSIENKNRLLGADMTNLLNVAQLQATNTINNAKSQADSILEEANSTKDDAVAEAEKIIAEANETAEKTITDAKEQAEKIINDAEVSVHDRLVEVNEKSENIAQTNSNFKDIIMQQISVLSDGLGSIMDLINNANETISNVTDKIVEDQSLKDLIENLPHEEVPELSIVEEEPQEQEEDFSNEETIQTQDITTEVENIEEIEELEPIETLETIENQEKIETPVIENKKSFDFSELENLVSEIENTTDYEKPQEENTPVNVVEDIENISDDDFSQFLVPSKNTNPFEDTQTQTEPEPYIPPTNNVFQIDGLDDLLKAVEDSTPDDEEIQEETSNNDNISDDDDTDISQFIVNPTKTQKEDNPLEPLPNASSITLEDM